MFIKHKCLMAESRAETGPGSGPWDFPGPPQVSQLAQTLALLSGGIAQSPLVVSLGVDVLPWRSLVMNFPVEFSTWTFQRCLKQWVNT